MLHLKLFFLLSFLTIICQSKKTESELFVDRKGWTYHEETSDISCEEGTFYNFTSSSCSECTVCSDYTFELVACEGSHDTFCSSCDNEIDTKGMPDNVILSYYENCKTATLEFLNINRLKFRVLDNILDDEGFIKSIDENNNEGDDERFEDEEEEGETPDENMMLDDADYKPVKTQVKKTLDVVRFGENKNRRKSLFGRTIPEDFETPVFLTKSEAKKAIREFSKISGKPRELLKIARSKKDDFESSEDQLLQNFQEYSSEELLSDSDEYIDKWDDNEEMFVLKKSLKQKNLKFENPSSSENEIDIIDDGRIDELVKKHISKRTAKNNELKWDKWVDDRVKPINSEDTEDEKETNVEELPVDKVIIVKKEDISVNDIEKEEEAENKFWSGNVITFTIGTLPLTVVFFIAAPVLFYIYFKRRSNARKQRTLILSSSDMKIMESCGRNAYKKMFPSEQVYDNPLFLA